MPAITAREKGVYAQAVPAGALHVTFNSETMAEERTDSGSCLWFAFLPGSSPGSSPPTCTCTCACG